MNNKIALLANADSFWVQRYIENVSIPLKQDVTIISASNNKYQQYYFDNGIDVIATRPSKRAGLGHRMDALKVSLNTLKAIRTTDPAVIHVHYAYPYILKLFPYIRKRRKKIVTFWGSDLLRAKGKALDLINKTAELADVLVVGAEDLFTKLLEINSGFEKKTAIIRMGLTAFDAIDKKRASIHDVRTGFLGDDADKKTVIAVGYNAGRAQQHLQVIEKLAELPDHLKSRIMIILPLTYQNEDGKYLDEIREAFRKTGIPGVFLTEFMDDEQIAELCLSTDIFINAQTTDALSGSMLEHIYSGSVVFNAAWLKYDFLDRNKINYVEFSNFDDLREKLVEFLSGPTPVENNEDAINIVKKNFSWSESRKKWAVVYKSMFSNQDPDGLS